ncbi:hypothetical protein [Maritimibacter sp. UBA3975]|mgnify:CR=1 FL=1|uniref:hypothetical protein n=1 Tax=Maritimibacter sp. UBA3975 TaxID=1946833 RepID=UPI000C0BAFD5|nr:hypothetical protein [Maritimibacter sp. UBA3975]MAM60325.1 hypothetical protein [Maritimibacter sp.]|tara:strand:+ start:18247 stop:18909 length:663 start_codon:yes stop_codon:yes gene_type:complete
MKTRTIVRAHAALVVCLAVSGCLNTTTAGGSYNSVAELIVSSNSAFAEAHAAGNTTIPDTGSATFKGGAYGLVGDTITSGDASMFAGEAMLMANFGAGTISGTVTNLVGAQNVSAAEFWAASGAQNEAEVERVIGTTQSIDGEIEVTNGRITGELYAADIAGTIDHFGKEIVLGGTGRGSFAGPDAATTSFYTTTSTAGLLTVTQDGSAKAGIVRIYGER